MLMSKKTKKLVEDLKSENAALKKERDLLRKQQRDEREYHDFAAKKISDIESDFIKLSHEKNRVESELDRHENEIGELCAKFVSVYGSDFSEITNKKLRDFVYSLFADNTFDVDSVKPEDYFVLKTAHLIQNYLNEHNLTIRKK